MANRTFNPVEALNHKVVHISGSVSIAADASVASQVCDYGTWTKSGTSEYTLTLTDVYNRTLAVSACVVAATAVDLVAQCKSHSATTGVYVFRLNTGATPTNPSAVCELHVMIDVQNTILVP